MAFHFGRLLDPPGGEVVDVARRGGRASVRPCPPRWPSGDRNVFARRAS
ncbi:MAG: hypothetical protein MZV64_52840 [Ignavibacteriales bacterium]|nr:hypothetical protein [Ignavibacteriales bacterium]